MFQAINDEDVDALKEILTEQNPELDNIRTVNTNIFVSLAVFFLICSEAHRTLKRHLLSLFSLLARCAS